MQKSILFFVKNFFFTLLVYYTTLNAQTYTITGYVTDKYSGETVIGAVISLKGTNKGVSTDVNGLFRLSGIEKGQHTLVFSHVSYEIYEQNIVIENRDIVLKNTELEVRKISIEEVSIVGIGSKRMGDREVETSLQEISMKAIKTIPSAGGDVFKALKFLPGIETSSPFSPLVSVRGGDPGENMIMLDGITIYNPYHVLGSMGIFNANTLKNVEILPGGFGAEFGGRNSSIINITTKDGNNNGLHGEVSPGTNYFNGFAEFPVSKKATMTVAARGFYPLGMNFIMYTNNWFYDLNLSYNLRINDRNRITVKYFSSADQQKIDFNALYTYVANMFDDDVMRNALKGIDFRNENHWQNNAATVMYHSVISSRVFLETQVYGSFHASDNASTMNFDMNINDTSQIMKYKFSSRFKSRINDVCLKTSLNYKMNDWNSIKLGAEANNYEFNNSAELDKIEKGNETRSPFLLAYFIEDKLRFGAVTLRPGIRFSQYSFAPKTYQEPRLNGVIALPGNLEIRAGWGIYYQYITSMNTSEYEMSQMLDYYYPLKNVEPSRSVHYITGIGKKFSNSISLSIDAYYKDITRIYTFNLTQSELEKFSFSDKLQEGTGRAYGIEALIKGQYRRFSGWSSMGLSRSYRKYPQFNNGKEFLSDYDKTFTFKGVCNYQVTERLSYSTSWLINSGHPITVSTTQQTNYYYEPNSNMLMWSPQYVASNKNNARLPMYIQIDIGFKKQIREGFGARLAKWLNASESYVTGSIENVTFFRRNVEYYFYIPNLDFYFPFGMNYFPAVFMGYVIKF